MVADPDLLGDYCDGSFLAEHHLSLLKFVDDLFRCISFPDHLSPLVYDIITGLVLGGSG